jgi:hypothetical protein
MESYSTDPILHTIHKIGSTKKLILHKKTDSNSLKSDLQKFDFTWQLWRMESIQRTSHSTFVKSDLRKFDLTWQLDPILP